MMKLCLSPQVVEDLSKKPFFLEEITGYLSTRGCKNNVERRAFRRFFDEKAQNPRLEAGQMSSSCCSTSKAVAREFCKLPQEPEMERKCQPRGRARAASSVCV